MSFEAIEVSIRELVVLEIHLSFFEWEFQLHFSYLFDVAGSLGLSNFGAGFRWTVNHLRMQCGRWTNYRLCVSVCTI